MAKEIFLKHESFKSIRGVSEFAKKDRITGFDHMDITTVTNDRACLMLVCYSDE